MSDEVLERFIQQYIAGVTGPEVVFSWQGGEPTLLGLDFFRKVVEPPEEYAKPGQRIENDLQTNGTSDRPRSGAPSSRNIDSWSA